MKFFTFFLGFFITLAFICVSISCKKPTPEPKKPKPIPTSVIDIDGNIYHLKRIENKLWMTENLMTTRYDTESLSSGDTVHTANNPLGSEDLPYYKDARNFKESPDTDNLTSEIRKSLGFLYNWCAAVGTINNHTTCEGKIQGICPNGWRLPTAVEWDSLCLFLDGKEQAGKKLKSKEGWYTNSGTNESGMNCYPAGLAINNNVTLVGKQTMFWSSKSQPGLISKAVALKLFFNQDKADVTNINKSQANSVRCIMDLDSTYTGF